MPSQTDLMLFGNFPGMGVVAGDEQQQSIVPQDSTNTESLFASIPGWSPQEEVKEASPKQGQEKVFNSLEDVYADILQGGSKLKSLFSPEALKKFRANLDTEELAMGFAGGGAGIVKSIFKGASPKMMPTSILAKIRDVDRNITPKSLDELDEITQSIKKEGIKRPITVTVSTADNLAYITDGNTRVTVAKNLGLTDVPVRFEKTIVPFTPSQRAKAKPLDEVGITQKDIPDRILSPEEEEAKKELLKLLMY